MVTKASPAKGKAVRSGFKTGNGRERVAITGMAQVNSLGNTPGEIWENVLALKSGITEIPASRWDHNMFYEPRPGTKEKTYCKVGAFKDVDISRKDLNIPPQDFRTMANATKLTLYLANQAIKDAGIVDSNIPRERIGILISQNSGESASTLGDLFIGVTAPKIVSSLRGLLHLTPEMALEAEKHIKAGVYHRGRHHAPGPAEQHCRRLHQQQVRFYGTVLLGLRRLRHQPGGHLQRHPDDQQRHPGRRGGGRRGRKPFSGSLYRVFGPGGPGRRFRFALPPGGEQPPLRLHPGRVCFGGGRRHDRH